MRTKTLILSALVGAAGLAAAVADPVYSLNAVGYINVTCTPGFTLLANQLNSTNATLGSLLPNAEDGSMFYKFMPNGSWSIYTYYGGYGWDPDPTTCSIQPGEGGFFLNPQTTNLVFTFVGEVPQGNLTNSLPSGLAIRSSIVPQAGTLDTALGFTNSIDGDMFYQWTNQNWSICTYYGGYGWDPVPVVKVGESFFYSTSQSTKWVRNFVIQ